MSLECLPNRKNLNVCPWTRLPSCRKQGFDSSVMKKTGTEGNEDEEKH